MRRYNWWFLLGGALLAAAIFAASLAFFPEWRGETRHVITLAALAVVSAFGFLASFRQAVEQPPDDLPEPHSSGQPGETYSPNEDEPPLEPPSEGRSQKTNRLDADTVTDSTVIVGDNNEFIQQQTIIQPPGDTPEMAERRAAEGRRRYLQAMQRHCQALNIAPLGTEANEITLEQVYIALDTTEVMKAEGHRLPALDAVTRSARVALLGAPGAGKSTFVRMIAGWLARAQLQNGDPPAGFFKEWIPILLTLRDLAPHLRREGFDDLPVSDQNKVSPV